MKKKIILFAFILCIFTCGVVLSACNKAPVLEFKEGASLTKEYDGQVVSYDDINEIINVSEKQVLTITFYQGETEIASPKNVGEYKVVISIPSKSIEKDFEITHKAINSEFEFVYNGSTQFTEEYEGIFIDFTFDSKNVGADIINTQLRGAESSNYTIGTVDAKITPKAIIGDKIINLVSPWNNKEGERSFREQLTTQNGLIEGDQVEIVVTYASYDANSTKTTSLEGAQAQNYTVSEHQASVRISLAVKFQDANGNKLTAFAVYGDNKLYKNGTLAEFSWTDITNKFGTNIESITINGSVLTDVESFPTLKANISGITDENGNWIVPNGKDATLTTFTVNLATAE